MGTGVRGGLQLLGRIMKKLLIPAIALVAIGFAGCSGTSPVKSSAPAKSSSTPTTAAPTTYPPPEGTAAYNSYLDGRTMGAYLFEDNDENAVSQGVYDGVSASDACLNEPVNQIGEVWVATQALRNAWVDGCETRFHAGWVASQQPPPTTTPTITVPLATQLGPPPGSGSAWQPAPSALVTALGAEAADNPSGTTYWVSQDPNAPDWYFVSVLSPAEYGGGGGVAEDVSGMWTIVSGIIDQASGCFGPQDQVLPTGTSPVPSNVLADFGISCAGV